MSNPNKLNNTPGPDEVIGEPERRVDSDLYSRRPLVGRLQDNYNIGVYSGPYYVDPDDSVYRSGNGGYEGEQF